MLTMARSLRSGLDKEVRFEPAEKRLVPNFARGGPNPVSIDEEPRDSRGGRTSNGADDAPLSDATRPQGELSLNGVPTRTAGMLSRLTAGRWNSGSTAAKPVLRADSKGQLSLHLVKVVRNDLSDSDLEVVPARLVSVPQKAPVAGIPEEPMEPEVSRWNRFANRFLRLGSGQ